MTEEKIHRIVDDIIDICDEYELEKGAFGDTLHNRIYYYITQVFRDEKEKTKK